MAQLVWPVRSGVMPALADRFCARAETAADLAAALVARALVVLVPAPISGNGAGVWLGSCGKTQLAVSVAESIWLSGKLELLVWVDASSRASVLADYVDAAVATMGADPDGDGEAVAARFARWLSRTSAPWLIVFDDLRNTADLDGLWPAGQAGRVLITTTDPTAFSGDWGTLLQPVGVYSPNEAHAHLVNGFAADPGKCQGAEDLAAELGYEPLAIAQAGAVTASSELSCRDYRDRFTRKRAELAATAGPAPPAASITWLLSAEHAERLSPGAAVRTLLSLAAVLDGRGIPGQVFTSRAACDFLAGGPSGEPADADRARAALLIAERTGLLSTYPVGAENMVLMNRAVQAAVRAAAPPGMADRAATAAADALLQVWPADEQPAWLARRLRSCTTRLWEVTGDALWADGCHHLLLRAGQSLNRAHVAGVSVAYWRDLAAASERILGPGHPDTLTARGQLAAACLAAGRPEEALSCYQAVLTERVRLLGPDHPDVIGARRDVGHALVAAGQFGEAVSVLDRVVSDYERVRGDDQPETLAGRDELGAAYHAGGRLADAVRVLRQTVASRERLQGPRHQDTVSTRQKLADACLADGQVKQALLLYQEVVSDRENLQGPDHPDTIAVRGTLGSAYYSAGRMALALRLREGTRASYERVVGADHPNTLASSADLARTYYAVGQLTDAMTLLRDTLARCEQTLAPSDPLTRAVRQSLASMTGQ